MARFSEKQILPQRINFTFNFISFSTYPDNVLLGCLGGGRGGNRIPVNENYHVS